MIPNRRVIERSGGPPGQGRDLAAGVLGARSLGDALPDHGQRPVRRDGRRRRVGTSDDHGDLTENLTGLGPGDQVYLSNYVSAPGTEYDALAAEAGIRPLRAEESDAQRQELLARMRAAAPEAIVAPYHVDGFAL